MADDISKKVLIDIDLANQDAQSKMSALESAINDLASSTANLKTVTDNAKTAFNSYSEKIQQSKLNVQQMREETARLSEEKKREKLSTDTAKQSIVAATGSYKEAQQALTKLGNEIKNTAGGFKSQDAALKQQIADYNKLNSQLKAFDAQMGNHQRNVGNYTSALSGFSTALNGIIPGFSQFSSILTGAARGFNAMGKAASDAGADAEVGMASLTASMGPVLVGIAAIIAAVASEITYLLQFQKLSDGISKTWSGIKGSTEGFMNYMNNNNEKLDDNFEQFKQHWSDFFHSIGMGYKEASTAQGLILDLARQQKNAATLTADEDMRVQLLIKDIRDRTTSATQAQKDYTEVLKINAGQYERNHGLAVQMFNSETQAAAAGLNLTKEQVKSITDLSLGYEKLTANAKALLDQQKIGKDFLDDYNKGLQGIIATDNKKAQSDEMAKIRDDMKQSRAEAFAEKEKQLQDEIARATEQANSEMTATTLKMLLSQQETFGRSLSETEEKARQSIFKIQQEIEKNQEIANNKKHSRKTRKASLNFIKTAHEDEKKIRQANYLEIEQLAVDHNRQMVEIAEKSANDLAKIQYQAIDQSERRELMAIENGFEAKRLEFEKLNNQYQDNINKLQEDIQDRELNGQTVENSKELQALKTTYNEQIQLMGDNYAEFALYEKKRQRDLDDTTQKYRDQNNIIEDNIKILKDNIKDVSDWKDEIQKIKDETQQKLDAAGLSGDKNKDGTAFDKNQVLQKIQITTEGEKAIDEIVKAHAKLRADFEIETSQEVADASFRIIQQSLARSNQAAEINRERQKNYDLSNQALTETQRYEINEKYRVLEGQAKVKAFHQEQELAIAQAVVNGALAIVKAESQTGVLSPFVIPGIIVETALQIATIAAEKPPAYAQGGIHKYESDGKGGVLPGYSKRDNTNAYLRSGEAVVVSEAMRDPWARNIVSAINQSYGGRPFDSPVSTSWIMPGFASGGVFTNYLPTGDNGLRPNPLGTTTGRLHPDDITGIASAVSSMNFSLPPIDIKDVNYQQQRLTNPYDRANY